MAQNDFQNFGEWFVIPIFLPTSRLCSPYLEERACAKESRPRGPFLESQASLLVRSKLQANKMLLSVTRKWDLSLVSFSQDPRNSPYEATSDNQRSRLHANSFFFLLSPFWKWRHPRITASNIELPGKQPALNPLTSKVPESEMQNDTMISTVMLMEETPISDKGLSNIFPPLPSRLSQKLDPRVAVRDLYYQISAVLKTCHLRRWAQTTRLPAPTAQEETNEVATEFYSTLS